MSDNKKTILIVEDDIDFLEQTSLILKSGGYNVISASNEKDAEKIISNDKYDLAILDLMLDNDDSGFVLSHKIKKINKCIPVILVTAVTKETGFYFDSPNNKQSWIKADVILNKDIRYEQLKGEIERLLKGE